MKKKIKDLSIEEIKKICKKFYPRSCRFCPLLNPSGIGCYNYRAKENYSQLFLNEEVEINE